MGSGAAARRAGQRPKKKPTNPEKTNASATASGATAVCQPAAKATTDSLGNPGPDPGIEQPAIGTLQPYRQIRAGYE
jgi:hypothetical protein